jgi:hypothetical protein
MKTLTIWLCLIVTLAISLEASAPINSQFADTACKACKDNCVSARERCGNEACTTNGGQNQGAECKDVKNQEGFVDALKACEDQEKACWNRCDASACKVQH